MIDSFKFSQFFFDTLDLLKCYEQIPLSELAKETAFTLLELPEGDASIAFSEPDSALFFFFLFYFKLYSVNFVCSCSCLFVNWGFSSSLHLWMD